jgi:hypothetical protein
MIVGDLPDPLEIAQEHAEIVTKRLWNREVLGLDEHHFDAGAREDLYTAST